MNQYEINFKILINYIEDKEEEIQGKKIRVDEKDLKEYLFLSGREEWLINPTRAIFNSIWEDYSKEL